MPPQSNTSGSSLWYVSVAPGLYDGSGPPRLLHASAASSRWADRSCILSRHGNAIAGLDASAVRLGVAAATTPLREGCWAWRSRRRGPRKGGERGGMRLLARAAARERDES